MDSDESDHESLEEFERLRDLSLRKEKDWVQPNTNEDIMDIKDADTMGGRTFGIDPSPSPQ